MTVTVMRGTGSQTLQSTGGAVSAAAVWMIIKDQQAIGVYLSCQLEQQNHMQAVCNGALTVNLLCLQLAAIQLSATALRFEVSLPALWHFSNNLAAALPAQS